MKKSIVLLCVVVLSLFTVCTSALAIEPEERIIDLGDGYYIVRTVTQYPMSRSGDRVSGNTSDKLYYGTTWIGTATLYASFDISGSTAKASDAEVTGSGHNGGEYVRGSTRCSGNTAYGTAHFRYNGTQKSVSLSLSCSPDGTLY